MRTLAVSYKYWLTRLLAFTKYFSNHYMHITLNMFNMNYRQLRYHRWKFEKFSTFFFCFICTFVDVFVSLYDMRRFFFEKIIVMFVTVLLMIPTPLLQYKDKSKCENILESICFYDILFLQYLLYYKKAFYLNEISFIFVSRFAIYLCNFVRLHTFPVTGTCIKKGIL